MARTDNKESLNYAQLATGWKHNFNSDFMPQGIYPAKKRSITYRGIGCYKTAFRKLFFVENKQRQKRNETTALTKREKLIRTDPTMKNTRMFSKNCFKEMGDRGGRRLLDFLIDNKRLHS
ncbi:hypothetical protein ACE13N_004854 [Escherichia coli O45:H11]|uniref:hypothetical protein n=1 Tax=Escherichia coli TaxID=562 RepID=UPI000BDED772|nr:hypothetical protein [Escherichia coli]EFN6764996.1 hypothetical protein [Escherichia coli O45:H11]EHB7682257.1 hypothetical protein [Escherichia coli]EIP3815628.1 hypothetical protein [Escherichia coli]EJE6983028.1 hypothetical protein [Escherichia coli]EJI9949457.1 hypothetical protein [Escherichia coli]